MSRSVLDGIEASSRKSETGAQGGDEGTNTSLCRELGHVVFQQVTAVVKALVTINSKERDSEREIQREREKKERGNGKQKLE